MNYEVAPFPLNNPLTPTTLEVHASVLRTACGLSSNKCQTNFKIYERAYHASKFSGEYLMSLKFSKLLRRVIKVLKFAPRCKFELSAKRSQILVGNS